MFGANRIVAWYFVTPVENVADWFWEKPGIAKLSETHKPEKQGYTFFSDSAPRRDFELFHELASGIDSEPFDKVVRINPLVVTPEQILGFETNPRS